MILEFRRKVSLGHRNFVGVRIRRYLKPLEEMRSPKESAWREKRRGRRTQVWRNQHREWKELPM